MEKSYKNNNNNTKIDLSEDLNSTRLLYTLKFQFCHN